MKKKLIRIILGVLLILFCLLNWYLFVFGDDPTTTDEHEFSDCMVFAVFSGIGGVICIILGSSDD
jgi:hypothetical protein